MLKCQDLTISNLARIKHVVWAQGLYTDTPDWQWDCNLQWAHQKLNIPYGENAFAPFKLLNIID